MMKKLFGLFVFLFLFSAFLYPQSAMIGIWQGTIHISNDSLAVVLVVENKDDTLHVVMDSPDQFVTDIPVSDFSFSNDSVWIEVKAVNCTFKGALLKDSDKITGVFTQNRTNFPLTFSRTATRQKFSRPQTPMPPYPYEEKELSFAYCNDFSITGTLTLPQTKPTATVILISGSGRQDRDENIFGHKPFHVIADYLTQKGYAVFRYDDVPMPYFNKMTSYNFADIALAIVDSLLLMPELKDMPIGLIGHSEGGLIAWMVAAQNSKIDFVVSLAGMGVPIKNILMYQCEAIARAEQLPEAQIQSNLALNLNLYDIVQNSKNKTTATKNMNDFIVDYTKNMTPEQRIEAHLTTQEVMMLNRQLLSPWFYELFKIEPKTYMKKVKCPVLALNGDKDLQVGAQENLNAMQKYLKKNSINQFVEIKGVNHLFQECTTGSSSEFGKIEQTFSPKVLETIGKWLDECVSVGGKTAGAPK